MAKKYAGQTTRDFMMRYPAYMRVVSWPPTKEGEIHTYRFIVVVSKKGYPGEWKVEAESMEQLDEKARELIITLEKRKLLPLSHGVNSKAG